MPFKKKEHFCGVSRCKVSGGGRCNFGFVMFGDSLLSTMRFSINKPPLGEYFGHVFQPRNLCKFKFWHDGKLSKGCFQNVNYEEGFTCFTFHSFIFYSSKNG